ncbi:exosporium protein, partial [Acidimicrobiaceae bacterium USS-CC1]|nr:exosporium protein [Acidiferrimicrobium australe]
MQRGGEGDQVLPGAGRHARPGRVGAEPGERILEPAGPTGATGPTAGAGTTAGAGPAGPTGATGPTG